jgi:hypothetical protein
MAGASHTPSKSGNPTTPDLAVVAQLTAATSIGGCDVQPGYTQCSKMTPLITASRLMTPMWLVTDI